MEKVCKISVEVGLLLAKAAKVVYNLRYLAYRIYNGVEQKRHDSYRIEGGY